MNDFNNYNIIKPKNITELYEIILTIVENLYEKHIPASIKNRKNKHLSKMTDSEIITIKILIMCLKMSEHKGYHFLKNNFPNLTNYMDRTRFNRTVNKLMTIIRDIRKQIVILSNPSSIRIIDSFPIPVCKFGRALFTKSFKGVASYGYCASKKETYFGFKGHILVDMDGNPIDILITKANIDDRDGLYELEKKVEINTVLADKGYIGEIETYFKNRGKNLIALKRKNSRRKLAKEDYRVCSRMRRRVETTISQLVEIFDMEKVRKTSLLGFMTDIEAKVLSFNILRFINYLTHSNNKSQIASLIFGY